MAWIYATYELCLSFKIPKVNLIDKIWEKSNQSFNLFNIYFYVILI